jgi:hypothetical protein
MERSNLEYRKGNEMITLRWILRKSCVDESGSG